MNRRLYVFMLAAVMAAALGLGGCMAGDGKKEENEKPVVVVLWHSYNAVAKGAFDDLVMEFNETEMCIRDRSWGRQAVWILGSFRTAAFTWCGEAI